jgi:hypothetical protein
MTTIVLLSAGVVAATSLGLALTLCVAAGRADRQMRNALLDALGWSAPDRWAEARAETGAVPYKEHTAS